MRIKQLSEDFAYEYQRGSLTCADNITRCARRVKEENAELRGYNHTSNKKKEQIAKKIFKKKWQLNDTIHHSQVS